MKLDLIIVHEETCPERSVTCPGTKCNDEVQMRKFNEHVRKKGCSRCALPNVSDDDEGLCVLNGFFSRKNRCDASS